MRERSWGRIRRGALLAAALATGCADGARTEFMSIGTAGTGGIYYPIGGAIAGMLSVADSARQYTAEVTGGSVENVLRLRSGQIDLAMATANTIFEAYAGAGDFDRDFPGLRAIAPLYPNFTHILVADGVDATDVSDFSGLRVSVGAPGSGTEQMSRQILAAHGLDYESVDERFLTFTESAAALRDRAIDAAIISVGYPAAAVLEATTTGGARLIGIQMDVLAELQAEFPYYAAGTLPVGVYPGLDEPLGTAALLNWIIGTDALAEDVGERILNILSNERVQLEQVHDMARQIDLALLTTAPVPLHEGAVRWIEGSR